MHTAIDSRLQMRETLIRGIFTGDNPKFALALLRQPKNDIPWRESIAVCVSLYLWKKYPDFYLAGYWHHQEDPR